LEESGRNVIKVLPENLPEGPRKTMKNLRIVCVPAEVRTEHLPNTSLERNRYVNLLDCTVNTGLGRVWKRVVVS
jgi:hypothetical protein